MIPSVSKPLRFKEGDGYLHGFSTGTVQVKSKFRTAIGGPLKSKIGALLDTNWTEDMAIMVWVVEHPEGLFMVDTGEKAAVIEDDYFKSEGPLMNWMIRNNFKFKITPDQEVGPQLAKLGFKPANLNKVIMTHLHWDHYDGLDHLKDTQILMHDAEWEKPSFALKSLLPKWFMPELQTLNNQTSSIFEQSHPLTKSGEIQLVHTPGHTNGHCSVLVTTNDLHYFLAGDVTYKQNQLEQEIMVGGHQNYKAGRETYKRVKNYASTNRTVYLPSHDRDATTRVQNDDYLKL